MSSLKKYFKILTLTLVVGIGLAAVASLKLSGRAYAAAETCSVNSDPNWVGMDVYVNVENPSGVSIFYSTQFTFSVTASVPIKEVGARPPVPPNPAVPFLDQTVTDSTGASAPGAVNNPSSPGEADFASNPISALGHTDPCAFGEPAYDFTDNSNGNYKLNCLGGATHGLNQVNSAAFAITLDSVPDATAGAIVGAATQSFGPTAGTDMNKQDFHAIFTFKESAPPHDYQGNLDSASCAAVVGWAGDLEPPGASVSVDINYTDTSTGVVTTQVVSTNNTRRDVNATLHLPPSISYVNWGFGTGPPPSGPAPPANVAQSKDAFSVSVVYPTATAGNLTLHGSPITIGPCDSAAPTATATADCRSVDFDNITAGDADNTTTATNYISYSLDGAAPTATNSMPATIALPSPNDQLGTHTLTITVQDIDQNGDITVPQTWPTFTQTWTYGPCYTLTCGPSNVPATIVGDPSSPSTFPVSMNMIFTPVPGADAPIATESDTIDGLNSYTAGVMSDVLTGSGGYTEPPNSPQTSNFNGPIPATAGNLSDATNIYNTFTEPATIGNYNVTFTFTDPAVPADDISCPPAMLQVVDAPYLTVQGGDVTAGSVFKVLPDQCTPDVPSLGDGGGHVYDGVFAWNQGSGGNYVGSGTDLAVQAMGDIYGFTSQAANNQTTPNALTFANNNPKAQPNSFGNVYNYAPCPPKINTAGAVGPTVKVSDGNSPEILGAGATKKIIVNGNAYITANVTYLNNAANPWTKPSDIPSFELVVEGNIFISSNVTELDGTYMAEPNSAGNGGNIYDCATITAPGTAANPSNGMTGTFASTAKCNNPLTVVGSFIAPDIYLQRDYGSVFGQSGGIAPTPAENFIYTPETWLNGPNPSDGNYDSLTSLPPIL